MTRTDHRLKILYFIPEDWYVCSHRLPLLREAVARGFEVVVATRVNEHAAPIEATGARIVQVKLRRGSRGLIHELRGLMDLVGIYRREKPDIVHHVTPKSVIFGTVAARLTGVRSVINAMAGLGIAYAAEGERPGLIARVATLVLRVLMRGRRTHLIVQNDDDGRFFRDSIGVPPAAMTVIRGAGVDLSSFRSTENRSGGKLRICLGARLIWEKGLQETVDAAGILSARRDDLEFLFAGDADLENPSGVPVDVLQKWNDEGLVTWLGRVEDMAGLLQTCDIALLPTYYREGLPKFLLEAAATSLPMIATDVTGCREICLHEENGILIPTRDIPAIVAAVECLADDPELRRKYGEAGRKLVEQEFSDERVVERTFDVYQRYLDDSS